MASLRRLWVQRHVFGYKRSAAEVFIGPYFASLGGVSHHLQSIHIFSKTRTTTLPNEALLKFLLKHQLLPYYKAVVTPPLLRHRLLHSHVDPWFISVCERAQQEGAKWVHTYHTLYFEKDWDEGLAPWQLAINKALVEQAKKADVKIAIAHWLKAFLKEQYQIDTVYIPNGVNVTKCDKANAERFIATYGLKDFILFASGISDIKNAGDFLRLANALPDKDFVIIGRGISKEALNKKFNVPLGSNLTILGTMEHGALLDAIAACKVFVVTSRSEGLPTVLMEAMALRRSVVGVNTYGTKEVIHSEKYGYLYEADNLEDLVQKTEAAYAHSKGDQARERILQEYDWRVIAPQLDALYQNLKHD
ncbi:MAG: glycosyltransferase family 4 protein [Flavobacteriaceae bacterium]|uniref:glycosyltransferase family 4 protein n=1 Tax=Phaeodactylibacter xiamenensis TaxID=1524460 RepID=UPI0009DCC187|nr:glycosyltransferase family 4 protein [Phaeodactylibacter xiamenensis]MCR9265873.1 glycosyltransferase family 4 protein [Flavobacteriaceae bacterium]